MGPHKKWSREHEQKLEKKNTDPKTIKKETQINNNELRRIAIKQEQMEINIVKKYRQTEAQDHCRKK